MRRCEVCGGPGPCLWAASGPNVRRYTCRSCHPEPADPFFAENARRGPLARLRALLLSLLLLGCTTSGEDPYLLELTVDCDRRCEAHGLDGVIVRDLGPRCRCYDRLKAGADPHTP